MTRASVLLLAVLASALVAPGASAVPQKPTRVRIAVAAFSSQAPPRFGTKTFESAATETLVRVGKFDVVTRTQLDQVLAEQKLENSDLVDPRQAQAVGRLVGAKYIVVGTLLSAGFQAGFFSKDRFDVQAELELIDVETGTVRVAETLTGSHVELVIRRKDGISTQVDPQEEQKLYAECLQSIALQFVDRINMVDPLEGYVLTVEGERVALNLAASTGVKPGQEFLVYEEGKQIKDPVTGELLAHERRTVARIVVTSVEEKLSWAEVVATYSPQARVSVGGELVDLTPAPGLVKEAMPVIQTVARAAEIRKELQRARRRKR